MNQSIAAPGLGAGGHPATGPVVQPVDITPRPSTTPPRPDTTGTRVP